MLVIERSTDYCYLYEVEAEKLAEFNEDESVAVWKKEFRTPKGLALAVENYLKGGRAVAKSATKA